MSGGHYNFLHTHIQELAHLISDDFQDGGDQHRDGATDEEWNIIINETNSLGVDLIRCFYRARELDLFMSGDNGPASYISELKELESLIGSLQNFKDEVIRLYDENKKLKLEIVDLQDDLKEMKDKYECD